LGSALNFQRKMSLSAIYKYFLPIFPYFHLRKNYIPEFLFLYQIWNLTQTLISGNRIYFENII
jgi:hypothetical protein